MKTTVIETKQQAGGRWIATFVDVPSISGYGVSEEEAIANAMGIGLRVSATLQPAEDLMVGNNTVRNHQLSDGTPLGGI